MYTHTHTHTHTEHPCFLGSLCTRTLILWDQGSTLMTSGNLDYLLMGPISKCSHMGVRSSTYKFGMRGHSSAHSSSPGTNVPLVQLGKSPGIPSISAVLVCMSTALGGTGAIKGSEHPECPCPGRSSAENGERYDMQVLSISS